MAATTSRARAELQLPKKWKERETSPERTKVWTEPNRRKVSVVYYLSRNGQLEHPHFMEVPLSSSDGLFLRDVINRLNVLRGNGMAGMYCWSAKRSYKNGFVWHDLAENDFIYPAHGQEYVLKGSELLEGSPKPKSNETMSSSFRKPPEAHKSSDDSDFPVVVRRRNQSWSSIDLHEYKVYKAESTGESAGKAAADASTQTDDKRRRRRMIREEEIEPKTEEQEPYQNHSTELSREEISPPPSDSSPETLESLMKADGRLILGAGGGNQDQTGSMSNPSVGRMKASSVLMQLISCGSMSFKDCGPTIVKDQGLALISQYKTRLPRGAANQETSMENPRYGGVSLEDKEYFSGSLIETKKDQFPALKRSSSYNADGSSQLEMGDKEVDGVRAKCIPRRSKTLSAKKESNAEISCSTSQHGSKRLEGSTLS